MKRWVAILLLLVTTFFWGITFTMVKEAIRQVDVYVFLSQRFWLAFFVLALISLTQKRRFNPTALKRGTVLGLFLFAAYAFQTVALKYTTASNAGFLTGLSVVFVPLIGFLVFRQSISKNVRWGVLWATIGLFLLCTNGTWTMNYGDLLTILCALCVAWHIIFTGEFAPVSDIYWLTIIQIGIVALLSTLAAQWHGHSVLIWHPEIFWALIICALFATVFAFLVQTSTQRLISPSHIALIFCTEPVFATLYAYWAAHERLGPYGIIGAILILTGMVISRPTTSKCSPTD
jgi:drug/metabolite transporter (DMT)-like permease